jgi:hypothetical protein
VPIQVAIAGYCVEAYSSSMLWGPGGGSGSSSGPIPIHMPGGVRFRHNPTAVGTISGIDFSLTFGPAPYGLQAPPVNLFGTCFPPKQ